jgi:RNA recognition motif-containing protein
MAAKLYVGGLAYSVTEQELETLFAEYGTVASTAVIKDRDSGQSKGFGFVEMSSDEEAQAAIKGLNGKEVSGRSIMVNEARPQEDRSSGGGGFRKSY